METDQVEMENKRNAGYYFTFALLFLCIAGKTSETFFSKVPRDHAQGEP